MRLPGTKAIIYCSVCVAFVALADLALGDVPVNLLHPDSVGRELIMKLRLPRVLTAIMAGAGLSLAGLQMQGIFRNPLADPHLMGVSAGAGFGAAFACMILPVMTTASIGTAFAAFLGAALSTSLVLMVSRRFGDSVTLLIFGVLLGYVFSAATTLAGYFASARDLKLFYGWSSGSFAANSWPELAMIAGALCISLALALCNTRGLDALLFGDEYALLAGVNVRRSRILALVSCCVVTGVVTAFCGPIGFVGIIAPHVARALLGSSVHRVILPLSMLLGSLICLVADLLPLLVGTPLPIGSTVAVLGVPIVIYILINQRYA